MCIGLIAMAGTLGTAGAAAGTLSTAAQIGMGLSALSAGTAMYGQYQQGKHAEEVAKINQESANIEADMVKKAGITQAEKLREQTRQTMARQRAEIAASGGDTTQGSTLDILKDTARFGAVDEANTISNARNASLNKSNEAQQIADQGKFGKYSSRLNMASTALSGAGQVSDKWYRYTNA